MEGKNLKLVAHMIVARILPRPKGQEPTLQAVWDHKTELERTYDRAKKYIRKSNLQCSTSL